MVVELGSDGLVEEFEETSVLLFTGGNYCPHSFMVALSYLAARSLGWNGLAVQETCGAELP